MASQRTLPLLLLDVDGVLCPIGPGPGGPMREVVAGPYPVRFSVDLPGWLRQLRTSFQLVWATGWEDEANRSLAPLLNIEELPMIRFPGAGRLGSTWKLRAVREFVGDRPFAWVDDELGSDAHRWASKRTAPTLLIDINPSWGIAAAHVDQLDAFAARLNSK